jgi:hypothetical protein
VFFVFLSFFFFFFRVDWATPRNSEVPKGTQQHFQQQQQLPSYGVPQLSNMIPSPSSVAASASSSVSGSSNKVDHRKTCQIHFSFIAKHNQSFVNENTIRTLFEGFGPVADVAIKKTTYDPQTTLQNGYGFVHFPLTLEGINTAIIATRNIHHVTINRIKYDSCLTRSLEEMIRQIQSGVSIEEITTAYSNGRIHNNDSQHQQHHQQHQPQYQPQQRRSFNEERENHNYNAVFPTPIVAPVPSSSQISLKQTSQWLFAAPSTSPSPTSVSNDLKLAHSRSSSFSSTGGAFSFSGASSIRDSFNSHGSSSESISEELFNVDEDFTMNLQNVLDSVLN